mmetsp:Transcript_9377/g.28594  ORF Transcript_9377/g.28594 Transcript_9377/m.28594 type:complete len:218 (+) Transcript_9377:148-801(+)
MRAGAHGCHRCFRSRRRKRHLLGAAARRRGTARLLASAGRAHRRGPPGLRPPRLHPQCVPPRLRPGHTRVTCMELAAGLVQVRDVTPNLPRLGCAFCDVPRQAIGGRRRAAGKGGGHRALSDGARWRSDGVGRRGVGAAVGQPLRVPAAQQQPRRVFRGRCRPGRVRAAVRAVGLANVPSRLRGGLAAAAGAARGLPAAQAAACNGGVRLQHARHGL